MKVSLPSALALPMCIAALGCSSMPTSRTDAEYEAEIVDRMHQLLLSEVRGVHQAALELKAALPSPVGRGWDASDQPAIDDAKAAWFRMRSAWERGEGTFAALFPDIDESLDSRYEDRLDGLGDAGGDQDLFDGQGVIGMHAVERILFAPETPPAVVNREASLPGYKVAAWPSTEAEAAEMKNQLCEQIVVDAQQLVARWEPQAIALSDVFAGLTGLMDAQQEKVRRAADHVEESRYAQSTMADLRSNLSGTRSIYDLFIPWLATKSYGTTLDHYAQLAFDRLQQTYDTVGGDAIPEPPATWSSMLPSSEDQHSAFGELYFAVVQEVDALRAGSAVDSMNRVAGALGLPELSGDQ